VPSISPRGHRVFDGYTFVHPPHAYFRLHPCKLVFSEGTEFRTRIRVRMSNWVATIRSFHPLLNQRRHKKSWRMSPLEPLRYPFLIPQSLHYKEAPPFFRFAFFFIPSSSVCSWAAHQFPRNFAPSPFTGFLRTLRGSPSSGDERVTRSFPRL